MSFLKFFADIVLDSYASSGNVLLTLLVMTGYGKLITVLMTYKEAKSYQVSKHIFKLNQLFAENSRDKKSIQRALEVQRFYGYETFSGAGSVVVQAFLCGVFYFVCMYHATLLPAITQDFWFSTLLDVKAADGMPVALFIVITLACSAAASLLYFRFTTEIGKWSLINLDTPRKGVAMAIAIAGLLSPLFVTVFLLMTVVVNTLTFLVIHKFFGLSKAKLDDMDNSFRNMAKSRYGKQAKNYIQALEEPASRRDKPAAGQAPAKAGAPQPKKKKAAPAAKTQASPVKADPEDPDDDSTNSPTA